MMSGVAACVDDNRIGPDRCRATYSAFLWVILPCPNYLSTIKAVGRVFTLNRRPDVCG